MHAIPFMAGACALSAYLLFGLFGLFGSLDTKYYPRLDRLWKAAIALILTAIYLEISA